MEQRGVCQSCGKTWEQCVESRLNVGHKPCCDACDESKEVHPLK